MSLRREPCCSSETTPQAKAFFSPSDHTVIPHAAFFLLMSIQLSQSSLEGIRSFGSAHCLKDWLWP